MFCSLLQSILLAKCDVMMQQMLRHAYMVSMTAKLVLRFVTLTGQQDTI